jgi:hypothetical protein
VKVRRAALDVVFVNRRVFGDCSVEPVLLGFACGIGDFDECDVTLRTGVLADGGAVGVSAAELVSTDSWCSWTRKLPNQTSPKPTSSTTS